MARFLQSHRSLIATPLIRLFAVSAFALLAFACGRKQPAAPAAQGSTAPLTKISFLTDWYPQGEHGGFYQAQARGFYREAGLDVTIVPGGPGATIEQKLLADVGQIAMARSDDVIVQASRGLPIVMVAAFMQRDPQALLLHEENPVSSFADLDGKSLMVQPSVVWPQFLMSKYGIRFNIIPLNYGLAQFMAEKNFIQQCFITNEPYYVRKNGAKPKTLLIADSGYSPYRVLATTTAFASEHPEALRAFVAASLRGWDDFMNGDPSPGKSVISTANKNMDSAFMDYSIQSMRAYKLIAGDPAKGERPGQFLRERLQQQIDQLEALKILPPGVSVEKVARFDFLPATP